MKHPRLWPVLLLPFLYIGAACSDTLADQPATITTLPDRTDVRRGETVTVWIDVDLSGDWHLYAPTTPPGGPYPTRIALQEETSFQQVGRILQPRLGRSEFKSSRMLSICQPVSCRYC